MFRKEMLEKRAELTAKAKAINEKYAVDGVLPAEHQETFDLLLDAAKEFTPPKEYQIPPGATIHAVGGSPLPPGYSDGDTYHGDNPASTFQFKNAETGELVSALAPGETFASRSPSEHRLRDEGKGIGDVLCDLVTGRDLSKYAAIAGDDSEGGFMTSREVSSMVIDLARSATVMGKAGANFLPMRSGQLDLVRVDRDPTAYWRAEAEEITASDVGYGLISLKPKTVAAIIPISMELMEDAANASSTIERQLQAALGSALDLAALTGSGAENQPLGIINHEGINEVASVGTPDDYSDITKAVGKILQANYPGEVDALSMILNPRDGETYDGLTDTTGQPLAATSWASKPKRYFTTSVPTNLGSGSDESFALLGDFSQCLIGMRTSGVRINVLSSGSVVKNFTEDGSTVSKTINAASSLQKLIVAYMRADIAVLRPSFFTKLTGITA